MARCIREKARVDYALSITGIAGPDGGTEAKPIGTVFIGLATPERCVSRHYLFPGDRERVRFASTQAALNLLRLELLRHG